MADISPPMNQVFLDFENVHQVDLSVFGNRPVSFTLLLGAQQHKIDAALLENLMQRAASVQIIRLTSSGKNALDFALAYYLGRAALADPTAHFHIISKDKGFDNLIAHLRSRHIKACRHDDFSTLTSSAADKSPTPPARKPAAPPKTPRPTAEPAPERAETPVSEKKPDSELSLLDRALVYLRKNTNHRPKSIKSLASDLRSHIGRDLADDDLAELIAELAEEKHISLTQKGAVSYHLE
jgi:hypothetical protein